MQSLKVEANKRFESLKGEGSRWTASWKDLKTYINQTRGRFDDQYNQGTMIDHKTILDGYMTYAQKILASGLLSGMTSPSRPWFRLTVDDATQDLIPGVREWLDEVQKRMFHVLSKSNMYGVLYGTYEEIGQFGTGCFALLDDYDDVIRGRSFTVGEYWLGADNKGRVNSFAREYWFQVSQLIEEFGENNVSETVMGYWKNNQKDLWVKCRYLIEPNKDKAEGMASADGMPYRSLYWEVSDGGDKFLAQRGFKRFPIIAPRWDTVTTDNVYGYGPGWYSLGDGKQLQKTNLDKLLAQEKYHNPPLQKDASVEGFVNNVPGGVTVSNSNTPNSGLRPAYQINPDLNSFLEMENSLKDRIDKFYFVNIFLMLASMDTTTRTATEIAERQQEKIMMMGPILHRLQEELLDPLVELIFGEMLDNGLLPQPPQELEGSEIKVQYVSVLAQAQQALGVQQIERTIGFVANSAAINPDIVDVINWDEALRQVSDLEGAPAKILNDPEVVAQIREARAQQQQMAQALEMAERGATAVNKMGSTPMDTNSALDGALGR